MELSDPTELLKMENAGEVISYLESLTSEGILRRLVGTLLFKRTDIKSVVVKFEDGTEMIAEVKGGGLITERHNDNGVKDYYPEKTWREWEIRWTEKHSE